MRFRGPGEEGRLWDWPNWTGPAAGALLGASVAARVDDKVVGILGGLGVFAFATVSALIARRRSAAATADVVSDESSTADRR